MCASISAAVVRLAMGYGMKKIIIITLSFIVAACSASVRPIPGPNNAQAFLVSCGTGNPEACYKGAASVCPTGYEIIDVTEGNLQQYKQNGLTIICK
jgi:hypothetical protein